jgi:hypothetical protein
MLAWLRLSIGRKVHPLLVAATHVLLILVGGRMHLILVRVWVEIRNVRHRADLPLLHDGRSISLNRGVECGGVDNAETYLPRCSDDGDKWVTRTRQRIHEGRPKARGTQDHPAEAKAGFVGFGRRDLDDRSETRNGQVPLGDETRERTEELGEKVTCGCVLESPPTWFLVGTIECSCGTGRTNFLRPGDARYSVRGWSLMKASLAQPKGREIPGPFFFALQKGAD